MRSRLRAGALPLMLALAAASCARIPPPRPPQPPPAQVAPGPFVLKGEPFIRIGLAWDLDSVVVTGGLRVLVPNSADSDRVIDGIKIGIAPTGLVFGNPGDRVPPIPFTGDTLTIRPERGTLRWNGKTWRGSLRVFLNPRGKLTLVDELPLETYLLGVVPTEIGGLTKELIEAGRAQAIAARSYTLFYLGRRASEGFDLYGTVEDQLYGPVESERPLAGQCVSDTRGEIAFYGDGPIRANYCSTCGGITAEVREAWPTPFVPYLESRRDDGGGGDFCAAAPQYRWRERWTAAEFLGNVERFAPMQGIGIPADTLGDLLDVRVAARSVSGRVWRLLVRTTAGDVAIPAYSIRQVLRRGGQPDAILRSNLFKIDVRRDPATGSAIEVVASGAGAGHGVGLCQTGALGMARAGVSAEHILEHYYPHAVVERRY
ncbi:MAG TPA: SpoIID/LytB domain-containing protein [Terriglobales bacterium]|nr:SpoIID/LytB domain-containing protein [Terriglobales bacterium]